MWGFTVLVPAREFTCGTKQGRNNDMRNPLSHFNSLDFWFEVAAIAGFIGGVCIAVGILAGARWLIEVGLCLNIPISLAAIMLAFVLIPIAIITSRKNKRR